MASVLTTMLENLAISSFKSHFKSIALAQSSFKVLSCGLRNHPAWSRQQQQPSLQILPSIQTQGQNMFKDIAARINSQISSNSHGRLFAVVHVMGKQFKVTDEDIIIVEGTWAPQAGDRIRLEKVLLVGSSDFTILGQPVLPRDLARVEATIVEKSLTETRTVFKKRRRKQYMRINFVRTPLTTLRINLIQLDGKVGERKEIEGVDGRVF